MSMKLGFFHLVQASPWPLYSSVGVFNLMISLVLWFHGFSTLPLFVSFFLMLVLSEVWWRDVERESTLAGGHVVNVKIGLKIGMILFIISEVMFFFSFFWSFVHSSSAVDLTFGGIWPPDQVSSFDPMSVPLVNTIILLSSGVSITWCHHLSLKGYLKSSKASLFLTVLLGVVFSVLQSIEYIGSPFSLGDGAIGSTFFVSTGFHGLHVLIGTSFLTVVWLKFSKMLNTGLQNVGFECSAWYWHFVDVVWLFLYSLIYWWGG